MPKAKLETTESKSRVKKPSIGMARTKRSLKSSIHKSKPRANSKQPHNAKMEIADDEASQEMIHDNDRVGSPIAEAVLETDQRIQQLQKQLEEAEKDCDRLVEANTKLGRFRRAFALDGMDFPPHGSDQWGRDFQSTCTNLRQWASSYVRHDTASAFEEVSAENQTLIIESLDGYCVQEDCKYLTHHFTEYARNNVAGVFAAIYLVKDVVGRFYKNRFWYLGPDPDAAVDNPKVRREQEEFASTLWEVGDRFRKSNLYLYEHWRAITCRLANIRNRRQGSGFDYGLSTKRYRETLIHSMVSDVLSSKVLQLLLKEPDQIKPGDRPYEQLIKIYTRTAEKAILMSYDYGEFEVLNLLTLDPTFQHDSESTTTAVQHLREADDPELEGRRILALTMPAVRLVFSGEINTYCGPRGEYSVWGLKAQALLEEKDSAPSGDQ